MAKWSVALFGHWKPRYYIIEKQYNVMVASFRDEPYWNEEQKQWEDGQITFPEIVYRLHNCADVEQNGEPGDIVDYKPYKDAYWTPTEKRENLIVTIDGFTNQQLLGLTEPYWDLNSYKPYLPMTIEAYETLILFKWPIRGQATIDKYGMEFLYNMYLESLKERCMFPQEIYRKRRFNIPLPDLVNMGVDQGSMLDKSVLYAPLLPDIDKLECYDKMNSRYILNTDGLNTIPPLNLGGL